ncbi:hypothetical protein QJS04_geneDACA019023 [Acorus gramineus]|uniref:Uncharacterized protein n=1 Tax=Acorus gramineus TaxID=55184 RepID=A0AAV9BA35_ACOGR|nr:hypothetical protein QJS04_geneDACA019023 [Acorus gramineus]
MELFGVRDEDLILYGQIVASGPTLDLASRLSNFRVVVLHSPILSARADPRDPKILRILCARPARRQHSRTFTGASRNPARLFARCPDAQTRPSFSVPCACKLVQIVVRSRRSYPARVLGFLGYVPWVFQRLCASARGQCLRATTAVRRRPVAYRLRRRTLPPPIALRQP